MYQILMDVIWNADEIHVEVENSNQVSPGTNYCQDVLTAGGKKNPKRENGLLGMKSVNLKGKQVSEGTELESFELEREVG